MTLLSFIHASAGLLPWAALVLGVYGLWPLLVLVARFICFMRRVLA